MAKATLLRFVLIDGRIAWDRLHQFPGRGAYVHPSAGCWSKSANLAKWEAAFRQARGSLDKESLTQARLEAYSELRQDVLERPARGGGPGMKKVRL